MDGTLAKTASPTKSEINARNLGSKIQLKDATEEADPG
jgi:hypothetical protein